MYAFAVLGTVGLVAAGTALAANREIANLQEVGQGEGWWHRSDFL